MFLIKRKKIYIYIYGLGWVYNIFKLIIYSIDSKWRFLSLHFIIEINKAFFSEKYVKKKKKTQERGNKDYQKFISELDNH